MKNEIKLEQYYSEDDNWTNFVDIAKECFNAEDKFKKSLINALNGYSDIAIVVYYRLESDSLEWIQRKIPALDNLKPIECLQSEKLINRLKECLMRMP